MSGTHKRDWEDLGRIDPCWAILGNPQGKYGQWDIDEFFRTGEREISKAIENCRELGLAERRERALDFGCGVGRLTRALADRFDEACGVDISAAMIEKARELHASDERVTFLTNDADDLGQFPTDHFDFIYTNRVLQHLPNRDAIEGYVREFLRVLRPGGMIAFQLLNYIALRARLQPRRRLYTVMRRLGFRETFLYETLGLNPIKMSYVPKEEMVRFLKQIGSEVIDVREDAARGRNSSLFYYVTKRARS